MPDRRLELIRQYCDTSGVRLNDADKDLLCLILEQPSKYDGFTSELRRDSHEGRDYRDTWRSLDEEQYRINIDSELSLDVRYRHCCDGYDQEEHWDWPNAWHITDIRTILEYLWKMEDEL